MPCTIRQLQIIIGFQDSVVSQPRLSTHDCWCCEPVLVIGSQVSSQAFLPVGFDRACCALTRDMVFVTWLLLLMHRLAPEQAVARGRARENDISCTLP